MLVLLCGDSENDYPRDKVLAEAVSEISRLRVVDLRFKIDWWKMHGGCKCLPARIAKKLLKLSIALLVRTGRVKAVLIFKNNHCMVPWVRALAERRESRKPQIIYDLWVSRVLVAQRDGRSPHSAWKQETDALSNADICLSLTEHYTSYYANLYNQPKSTFRVLPMCLPAFWLKGTGASREKPNGSRVVVAYWGSYLPQHGVDVLIEAARLLEGCEPIEFRLFGRLNDETFRARFASVPTNVSFRGEIPTTEELIRELRRVDIGVGHLNAIHDAHLVLPNKVWEGLAVGLRMVSIKAPPTATAGDSPISPHIDYFSGGALELSETFASIAQELRLGRESRRAVLDLLREKHSSEFAIDCLKEVIVGTKGGV